MKRLAGSSGSLVPEASKSESDNRILKAAILVHSGPNGEPMVFMSGDGEISFDDKRIQRVVTNQNNKIRMLAGEYGGVEKMPPGAWTPILDQHDSDSNDRKRGRLASLLRFEKRNVPGVGKNVACAVADIEFLGKDVVEKVRDGRIYHLSIGIDESTDTLGEVSTVIEPAAPGAMLLSKSGSKKKGDEKMGKKLARLAAHADRMAKLTALQSGLKELTGKIKTTSETVKLARLNGEINGRLVGLMRAGKMTPAEYKNLNEKVGLTRLSAMKKEDLDVALAVYESREKPVVDPTVRGTAQGEEVTRMTKELTEKKRKRMFRAEIAQDFKKLSGKKFNLAFGDDPAADKEQGGDKQMAGGNDLKPVNPGDDPHAVAGQAGVSKEMAAHLESLGKHLAGNDIEKAKEAHQALSAECKKMTSMAHLEIGDVKSEDYKKAMDAHQAQIDELNTNMARLAGMVEELMSAEKSEAGAWDQVAQGKEGAGAA